MKKRVFHKTLLSVIAAAIALTICSVPAFAAEGSQQAADKAQTKAKRTVLLYDCGSDLETEAGLASYNLRQVLNANFSKNEDVRFIVMTGGADKWHLEKEKLVFPEGVNVPKDAISLGTDTKPLDPDDPTTYSEEEKTSQISNTYNQIWEARGADAVLEDGTPDPNAGKLVLLDGDGVLGDGEDARRSIVDRSGYVDEGDGYLDYDLDKMGNYEWMNEPEVLKAFIDYGAENFPADKYDLILWDHGAGPDGGFCSNLHETSHGMDTMELQEILDALSHNKVVDSNGDGKKDGTFDLINFDACLMNSVEIDLLLSDLTDYYIASPEVEPGYGQEYKGWLDKVGENPEMDTYELGRKIVDDFVAFYNKESGDGSSQEGTLAVIDMKKLMTTKVRPEDGGEPIGFLEGMTRLNQHLQNAIAQEGLYYDEFRSFKGALRYGDRDYYDLGNLLSQLSYVYDEADYDDLKDGGLSNKNAYTATARVLTDILNNEDIIYARGTEGIRTGDQFYRNASGEISYGSQGTSGMFMCFDPRENPREIGSHNFFIKLLLKEIDPADPRTALLKDLNQTMLMYGLTYHTGMAVTDMVTGGMNKNEVDYDAVRKYWDTHTDKWGEKLWDGTIQYFMKYYEGGEDDARVWLAEKVIPQQRDEVVLKDEIRTRPFRTKAGTGCAVTLNKVRKQAIDSVSMDLIAELPAVEAFMKDDAHAGYVSELGDIPTDLVIGRIQGSEVCDIDLKKDGYKAAIDWLFDPSSEWKLDPAPDKWYALKDAKGRLYATAPDFEDNEIQVPAGYFTTELVPTYNGAIMDYELQPAEVCHLVYLIYEKDAEGTTALTQLYFKQENGSWRGIPASEYKGSLKLYPLVEVSDDWDSCYLPITAENKTFTLSRETVGKLELKYMDIRSIPDIADTDSDKRALHSVITVNNIYGHRMDITDLVNDPTDKMTNALSVKSKTAKVKYKKLKKKAQKLKVSKVIRFVKKGDGKVSYAKLSGNKKIRVNGKTGQVTIKKGLKKGTYKVKVKVKAAGNAACKPSAKTVTIRIRVK